MMKVTKTKELLEMDTFNIEDEYIFFIPITS